MPRRLRTPLILLAALLLLHSAAWLWAARHLAAAADGWLAAQRARGVSISADAPVRGGWPLGVSLTWPRIAIADPAVPLAWSGEGVTLAASLLHPRHATLDLAGPQMLRLADLPPLAITADRFDLDVRIGADGRAHGAGLAAHGLRISGDGAAIGVASLSLSADGTGPGRRFGLHAEAIALPGTPPARLALARWPFGPAIQRLGLDATLSGTLPPDPRASAAWMRAWQQAGGALAIDDLNLDWGPLDVTANARLAADPTGQPIASMQSEIGGWQAAADALAAAGLVTAQTLRPAKLLLSLMAHTDAPGGPSTLSVPLNLDGGTLSMGRMPLAQLPPLP